MSDISFSVGIYTLGCKVNQYESEAIAERLMQNGLRILPPSEQCDAYIINTCTVTAESDRKARQFIRRAVAKNPLAYIVVTGCFAQTSPQAVAEIPGVDAVIGNKEKLAAADEVIRLLRQGNKNPLPCLRLSALDGAPFEAMQITSFERTRAYIKIEDGCENHCTYCIIPDARGEIRSKPPEQVLEEARTLTRNGCPEIVLTGIETASYGKDLTDCSLLDLLKQVDQIPHIGRVRLGSLDPSLIRPAFAEQLASLTSLAPHFHLSLQSGSSRILASMKRKYNAEQAMRAIELLRASIPHVKFTTDIIVGFPGETEEDFQQTLAFVRQARFLTVHIFPYSKRKGTPAAVMPDQVPEAIKRQRLHELDKVAAQIRRELLQEEIRSRDAVSVLFETYENRQAVGHTADFLEVSVPSPVSLHAEVRQVLLRETDGTLCYGELADPCLPHGTPNKI